MDIFRGRQGCTVYRFVVSVLLLLCLAVSAQAEVLNLPYYSVDLPKKWKMLQHSDVAGVSIAVFSTSQQDVIVTLAAAPNDGSDLNTVASVFAQQYRAKGNVQYGKQYASFRYENYEGIDSIAYVAVDAEAYMVTTISGSQSKARAFLKTVASERFPKIVVQP